MAVYEEDKTDTIHLYCKYYCLHDSALIIPKKYSWSEKDHSDFVAHNPVTRIVLINNRDTVYNKIVAREEFNNVLYEALRNYVILLRPDYIGFDKNTGEVAISYSISIPITDLGVPATIAINEKGNYRILDEYAKMDSYKK